MRNQRQERLNSQYKEEIADLLRKAKDPRIGFVSVTEVEVTGDLRQARVYVSVLGNDEARAATLAGLKSATGYIRTELAQRIRLRTSPEIEWRYDTSIEHGARINEILSEIRREGQGGGSQSGSQANDKGDPQGEQR